MTRLALLAALLLTALFAPEPLVAQDRRHTVELELTRVSVLSRFGGFIRAEQTTVPGAQIGAMPAGQMIYLSVDLEAGAEYLIAGYCDSYCNHLDFYLVNDHGEVVVQDMEMDKIPILRFVAPEGRSFLLGISMESCEIDYCFFGYQVLKDEGTSP